MYLSFKNQLSVDNRIADIVHGVTRDLRLHNKPLTIQVEFTYLMNSHYHGYMTALDNNYFKVVLNREGKITDRIDTVAHELRHVWQKINNKFQGYERTRITTVNYTEEQFQKYLNQPHELDAVNYAGKYLNKVLKRRV